MKTLFCFVTAFAAMAGTAFADALEGKRAPAEIIESAAANDWRDVDPAQVMVIDLERGRVTIELSDVFAQGHVAQMKTLAKAGFYNGLSFYRVIDGFVAQGGDPFETKELPDGAIKGLKAEFDIAAAASEVEKGELADFTLGENDGYANSVGWRRGFALGRQKINGESRYHLLHCTGAIAMARDIEKDTGGTEFYITLQPQRYLDRNLTVFGRVIDGMEHVQALKRQPPPEEEGDPLGETIVRAWMGDAPPEGEDAPTWQVFRTNTALFAEYVESRRNRPEAFFYYRPDHVDVCQLTIPVREKPAPKKTADE